MRGSRAKALRAEARAALPAIASPVPLYQAVLGTERTYTREIPDFLSDDPAATKKVPWYSTVTFQLAPTCVRYWTQRFKRHYVRHA
jgi:hypothetical protein